MKKLIVAGLVLAVAVVAASEVDAHRRPFSGGGQSLAGIVAASGGEGQFDDNPFDYDLLLNAVIAADLVGALSDENATFTLFAPNDLAFLRTARDLGFTGSSEAEALEFLLEALAGLDENGDAIAVLTTILLYHVVPAEADVFDFILASIFRIPLPTLQGGEIRPNFFTIGDNDPDISDPGLFFPLNVRANNGILHTISRVLIPIDIP